MESTVIIYGSSTGTCQTIAETMANKLGVKAIDVSSLDASVIENNRNLLLGTSTWGAGELQDDWYDGIKILKNADLSSKTVAIFGCGDGITYGDTFCNAMKELYDAAVKSNAKVIGKISVEGYTYDESEAVEGDEFVGLPLDDVNEDNLTEQRIDSWLAKITPQL